MSTAEDPGGAGRPSVFTGEPRPFCEVNADEALRQANRKFADRFSYIEQKLAAIGKTPEQASLREMDALWDEYKMMKKD